MTFLYPIFLFAFAALAIPVIIHLFNFRRAKRIYFSSTQFLKSVRQSTSSKLKVKHLLVLASRLLFLFFLVITFSQPIIPGREEMGNQDIVYIYLDNSMSMSDLADDNVSGLEAGIFHTRDILKTFLRNTRYVFLTNDFAPFANSPKSSDDLDKYLSVVGFSGQTRTFNDIYERLRSLSVGGVRKNIYWISDFQSSTLGLTGKTNIDSIDHIYLIPVAFPNTSNIYTDTVYLDNPFLIQGESNKLNIVLKNDGNNDIKDALVNLFVNDLQVANTSMDIKSNSTVKISFDLNFPLQKMNRCRLSFEDFPVAFDNSFFFILTLANKIRIVEIKRAEKATVVEKVYGNKDLFDFKTFKKGNIDYNLARSSDLLVLNEPGIIDNALMTLLKDYYDHGGTMVIIADKSIISGIQDLPALQLNPSKDTLLIMKPLADPDLANPFYSEIFESTAEKFTMPVATSLFILPVTEALLKFRDGTAFLSRTDQIFLFSCPLTPEYTNFQNNAIFVPIMYRTAMMSKKTFNRLYYNMDNTMINLRLDSIGGNALIKLTSSKNEIVPTQRVVGNELILNIPKSELQADFYNVLAENQSVGAIAYNYTRQESEIKQLSAKDLSNFFTENSNIKVFNIKDINKFDAALKENFLGKALWKYTLVLALIFLLAEILLIRFL